MQIHTMLREIRTDNDYKQKEVADLLSITQQQYQLYESGKRSLPVEHLYIFCNHFKISADYMLGLEKGLRWPR